MRPRSEEQFVICPKCGLEVDSEENAPEHHAGSSGTVGQIVKVGYQSKSSPSVASSKSSLKVMDPDPDGPQVLPTTSIECPKCKNGIAFWWMLQTRSADEATTQFYRCTKCSHTWRNYS